MTDPLPTVALPGTDLAPSRIGLGTWAIGGWMWGGSDDEEAVSAIRAAIERGITLIDTAPVYGMGRSEAVVGRAISESGARDRLVISTKCGLNWEGESPFRDARPERLHKEVNDSLARLDVDAIDVLHVHWPDPLVDIAETAEAMRAIHESGKARAVGVSNMSPDQIDRFREHCPLHVVQPPYNLFERGIEEALLPHLAITGQTTMVYGALCRGLLSGKMTAERRFEGDDLRQSDPKFQPPRFQQYLAAADRLDRLAQERYGKRVLHLALRWLLDRPGVGTALWGARRPDQLDPVSEVWDFTIDAAGMAEIDAILDDAIADPIGPDFMAPPARAA